MHDKRIVNTENTSGDVFVHFLEAYGMQRATRYADRNFVFREATRAVVAQRYGVGDDVGEERPKRAGEAARFAAHAAHRVPPQNAVRVSFERLSRADRNAQRILAPATDDGHGGSFAKGQHSVVRRVVEIIALGHALGATQANLKVNEEAGSWGLGSGVWG